MFQKDISLKNRSVYCNSFRLLLYFTETVKRKNFLSLLNSLYTQLHLETVRLVSLHQCLFVNEHLLAHQYCTLQAV